MDYKGEAKALDDAERHAREFITKNKIPIRQWQLAEEMLEDLRNRLLAEFWKLWEENNGSQQDREQQEESVKDSIPCGESS